MATLIDEYRISTGRLLALVIVSTWCLAAPAFLGPIRRGGDDSADRGPDRPAAQRQVSWSDDGAAGAAPGSP